MSDEKTLAVKVFSFPKKKKVRAVSAAELDRFERQLSQRSRELCAKTRAAETLTAADYSTTVTM